MVVEVDLQPMSPGFESRNLHDFFIDFFFMFFLSLLLQCKFAISTLLPLLSFSYFMTPYDAQASSAFSALINLGGHLWFLKILLVYDNHQHIFRSARGDNRDITEEVGQPICEAFVAYDKQEYSKAVDLIYPLRYKIWKIGGSHAQVRRWT